MKRQEYLDYRKKALEAGLQPKGYAKWLEENL